MVECSLFNPTLIGITLGRYEKNWKSGRKWPSISRGKRDVTNNPTLLTRLPSNKKWLKCFALTKQKEAKRIPFNS